MTPFHLLHLSLRLTLEVLIIMLDIISFSEDFLSITLLLGPSCILITRNIPTNTLIWNNQHEFSLKKKQKKVWEKKDLFLGKTVNFDNFPLKHTILFEILHISIVNFQKFPTNLFIRNTMFIYFWENLHPSLLFHSTFLLGTLEYTGDYKRSTIPKICLCSY